MTTEYQPQTVWRHPPGTKWYAQSAVKTDILPVIKASGTVRAAEVAVEVGLTARQASKRMKELAVSGDLVKVHLGRGEGFGWVASEQAANMAEDKQALDDLVMQMFGSVQAVTATQLTHITKRPRTAVLAAFKRLEKAGKVVMLRRGQNEADWVPTGSPLIAEAEKFAQKRLVKLQRAKDGLTVQYIKGSDRDALRDKILEYMETKTMVMAHEIAELLQVSIAIAQKLLFDFRQEHIVQMRSYGQRGFYTLSAKGFPDDWLDQVKGKGKYLSRARKDAEDKLPSVKCIRVGHVGGKGKKGQPDA